jgi:hypothetical protein
MATTSRTASYTDALQSRVPVNNALLDPFQGHDADVYVLDQGSGKYILVGRFTSIQLTIRSATEAYLELNQKAPRYLDGEIMIGWVMERGQLDTRVLEQTFGFRALTRNLRVERFPRFQIHVKIDAPSLSKTGGVDGGSDRGLFNGVDDDTEGSGFSGAATPFQRRKAVGELVLTMCKVDTFTMGIAAGKNVIANRWEGVAEGIEQIDDEFISPINAGLSLSEEGGVSAEFAINNALLDDVEPFEFDEILLENYFRTAGEGEVEVNFVQDPQSGVNEQP